MTLEEQIERYMTEQDNGCWHWAGPAYVKAAGDRFTSRQAAWAYAKAGKPNRNAPSCANPECHNPEHFRAALGVAEEAPIAVPIDKWADDILNGPMPKYLLNGALRPGGLTIVAGPPKVGKSLVVMDMCLALSLGKERGPWEPSNGAQRIGLIDLDGPARITAERIARYGELYPLDNFGANYLMLNTRNFLLLNPEHERLLYRFIEEFQLSVIVVDPLFKSYGGDENNSAELGKYIFKLQQVCAETGVGTLLIHHNSKGWPEGALDPDRAMRGSSALASAYDNIVSLQQGRVKDRFESKYVTVLMTRGKNEGLRWCRLERDVSTGILEYGAWEDDEAEWFNPSRK